MDTSSAPVRVFVIDDNDSSAVWDLRLAEDFSHRQERGSHSRRLVRYGDVCTTAAAGRAMLLQSLREGLEPDLVVVDHILSTGGPHSTLEAGGLGVLRWLRDECERRDRALPKCVLWTADYSAGLAFAFARAGGKHAFSRRVPAREFMAHLWDVYDGDAVWEHHWTPPKLDLTPLQLLVMPYFEANLPTHEIAARMWAAGELECAREKAEDWINQRRGDIMARANLVCEQLQRPRFEGRGLSVALAQFAIEHGNIWIPLPYRE